MIFYIFIFLILFCIIFYNIFFKKDKNFENIWLENENTFVNPKSGESQSFPNLLSSSNNNNSNSNNNITLSVIVPAYNEQDRIKKMLDEAIKFLNEKSKKQQQFTYEVIVIDDGSKDKTSSIVMEYVEREGSEKIRLLKLLKNRGKGGAVKRGMLCSRGKYCLMVDADGATEFKDIERVQDTMSKIEKKGMGVVVGSRSHLVDSDVVARRSIFRNLLMYLFHLVVETLAVKGIKDTQCGFKLFTRETAKQLFPNQHVERWAFDVELLYIAQSINNPIAEVAVNWQEIDGSKLDPIAASIQMAKDILRIRLNYLLRFWTIKNY